MREVNTLNTRFYDLLRLRRFLALVRSLDPLAQPDLIPVCQRPRTTPPLRVGLLPGSFNPLTNAHLALARLALESHQLDQVLLVLAKRTVDKTETTGMALEDRLLVLCLALRRYRRLGVAMANRGLYVDQADAARRTFPWLPEVYFVVGFDKLAQILDPQYYADRDYALDRLFASSVLLVAPRGVAGARDLDALMARPENHRFRGRVKPLELPAAFRGLSSTLVRDEARVQATGTLQVPSVVADFIAETGVYEPSRRLPSGEPVDAYALRLAILRALDEFDSMLPPEDLASLVGLAKSDTSAGAALRRLLAGPRDAELAAALHRLVKGAPRPRIS